MSVLLSPSTCTSQNTILIVHKFEFQIKKNGKLAMNTKKYLKPGIMFGIKLDLFHGSQGEMASFLKPASMWPFDNVTFVIFRFASYSGTE